ncbi:MAG: phosphate/phosphite/phosphonate ABC transporter substrate-binding protein [Planctomycetota bacterium]
MKLQWIILTVVVVLGVAGAAMLLSLLPPQAPYDQVDLVAARPPATPIALGLLAEHDVLDQRRRVRALTAYLSRTLGRPVEFITENRYESIYDGLRDERIDVALLPGMPTLGATIHADVQLVAHLERPREARDAAVIFVAASTRHASLEDLEGGSIALLRGCVAGELYPRHELQKRGLVTDGPGPRIVWASTHAEVIRLVVDGGADAGATWQRHVRRFEALNPDAALRPLAVSDPLPGPIVVARAGFAGPGDASLQDVLYGMHRDLEGRKALAGLDAAGFGPIESDDVDVVRDMVEQVDELREMLGLSTSAESSVAPPLGTDSR